MSFISDKEENSKFSENQFSICSGNNVYVCLYTCIQACVCVCTHIITMSTNLKTVDSWKIRMIILCTIFAFSPISLQLFQNKKLELNFHAVKAFLNSFSFLFSVSSGAWASQVYQPQCKVVFVFLSWAPLFHVHRIELALL